MNLIYQTKEIYKQRADCGNQYWQGQVFEDKGNYYISTLYKNGQNGTEVESDLKLIEGKNIGKRNYKPPKKQAILEIESRLKKKLDSGYTVVGESPITYIYPMLAKKFDEKKVKFPCFIQPKLDGCRAIYIPEEKCFRSRKQKKFLHLDHLTTILEDIDIPLDGELILPKGYSFQDTISALKRKNENTPLIEFHVFDIVSEDSNYEDRLKKIHRLLTFRTNKINVEADSEKVKKVKTLRVKSLDDIRVYHDLNKNKGYEGSIIRNPNFPYEQNKRSSSLLKIKDIMSDEFKIVDIQYDTRGAVFFVCEKNNKQAQNSTFEVCPTGSLLERKNQDYSKQIGKLATINYYGYTDDFAPKFANVIAIRDYE